MTLTFGFDMRRQSYLVIGDVHGCYDELIKMIDRHGQGRHIVSVGDLVDKGPHPERCLELMKLLDATVVKGNHEDNHIRYAGHEKRYRMTGKKNPMRHRSDEFKETHRKIYASPLDLIEFMERFPTFMRLHNMGPEARTVVVLHGGLLPGRTPGEMDPKKIIRVRNIKTRDDGTHSFANLKECEADPSLPFWTDLYTGEDWVLFGHAPFLKPVIKNRTVALDTGCVYGNRLTGFLLPEMELVSVPARKVYQKRWDDLGGNDE
jgi:hypothetical protein